MHVSKRTALAVAGVAAIAFAVPALAKPTAPSEPSTCGNTDVQLSISQNMLWPPNHKMVPIQITATDNDGDNDNVTVTLGMITNSDETDTSTGAEINGTGQPDASPAEDQQGSGQSKMFTDPGSAVFDISLAAERSGHDQGSGRTYSIPVTCTETMGTDVNDTGEAGPTGRMDSTTLTVFVPHDQGNNVNG